MPGSENSTGTPTIGGSVKKTFFHYLAREYFKVYNLEVIFDY